jgi:hypothetical protein
MTGKGKPSANKSTAAAKPAVNKGGRPKGTTAENHLTTPTAVRTAMVQCYREAKSKKLDSLVASRLVTILTQIQQMNNVDDIERRLLELEEKLTSANTTRR